MENYLPARFNALGDATRLAVVERLSGGSQTVSDLAKAHPMVLSAFTKHLGILERAGLITTEKVGRVRICHLNHAAMADLEGWLTDRQALWNRRLHRLERLIQSEKDAFP